MLETSDKRNFANLRKSFVFMSSGEGNGILDLDVGLGKNKSKRFFSLLGFLVTINLFPLPVVVLSDVGHIT